MSELTFDREPISDLDNSFFLHLTGRIDARTVPKFQEKMDTLQEEGAGHVVLNMGDVDYINSTGLGALVKLFDSIEGTSREIVLANIQDGVRVPMESLGVDAFFEIFDSTDEAVEHLTAPGKESASSKEEAESPVDEEAKAVDSEPDNELEDIEDVGIKEVEEEEKEVEKSSEDPGFESDFEEAPSGFSDSEMIGDSSEEDTEESAEEIETSEDMSDTKELESVEPIEDSFEEVSTEDFGLSESEEDIVDENIEEDTTAEEEEEEEKPELEPVGGDSSFDDEPFLEEEEEEEEELEGEEEVEISDPFEETEDHEEFEDIWEEEDDEEELEEISPDEFDEYFEELTGESDSEEEMEQEAEFSTIDSEEQTIESEEEDEDEIYAGDVGEEAEEILKQEEEEEKQEVDSEPAEQEVADEYVLCSSCEAKLQIAEYEEGDYLCPRCSTVFHYTPGDTPETIHPGGSSSPVILTLRTSEENTYSLNAFVQALAEQHNHREQTIDTLKEAVSSTTELIQSEAYGENEHGTCRILLSINRNQIRLRFSDDGQPIQTDAASSDVFPEELDTVGIKNNSDGGNQITLEINEEQE